MTTSPSVVACARGDAHRPWPSAGGGAIAHASEEPATPRERAPPAIAVFEHVLQMCARAGGRILTIHGRRAEKDVVVLLERNRRAGTPVLHWFSGSLRSCCTHRPSPEYSKECSRPATSPCQPVADIVQSGMRAASYCEDTTYKVETAHRHVSRLFCGPYGAGSPHWTISATGSSARPRKQACFRGSGGAWSWTGRSAARPANSSITSSTRARISSRISRTASIDFPLGYRHGGSFRW